MGIALLNTVATSATAAYLAAHGGATRAAVAVAAVHGFSVAIWISVGFLLSAAVVAGTFITAGSLGRRGTSSVEPESVAALV